MTFTPTSSRSTGGITSGTSQPAGPASGDLFFRTDLGLLVYYDGTRWLTVDLYHETFGEGEALIGTVTSPANVGRSPSWGATFDMYLVSADIACYVATTNTGAAFWVLDVAKVAVNNTTTSVATYSTTGLAADQWNRSTVAIGAALGGGTTYPTLALIATKTGAPGAAYATAAVRYRLIVT